MRVSWGRHGSRAPATCRPTRRRLRRRRGPDDAGALDGEPGAHPRAASRRPRERQRARRRGRDGAVSRLASTAPAASPGLRGRHARRAQRRLRPLRRPCGASPRGGRLARRACAARADWAADAPRADRGRRVSPVSTLEDRHHGAHGHSHGLVDASIKRSRAGLRVVGVSLAVLAVTAVAQAAIYVATGSVALLADLIHNAGDALTAVPLGAAFLLRSERAERGAGVAVVLTILASAVAAGVFAVERIVHPLAPEHLLALGLAGAVGVAGNGIAARVRLTGGRRIDSAALIADGQHARSDAIVSVGVILSAAAVALGAPIVDPIIGLAITALILRITWQSWRTVRAHDH